MKKLFFSLLIAFTVIFAGCKQNFLQSTKDGTIDGYAKVSVNYEESDRAVYPDVDEFKKSLGSAKYTLLCDDKVVELDSNKSVLIPYGTHTFTLYLSNNTGSIFYEGKKSQEEINQSTTTLTFSLTDSVVKGALDYYFALIKNTVTQRIDSWYSYILKTELLNINDISSGPIEVTVNELPMIVYNEALESSCAYYLYNLVTYDVEPGTYLLTIKGDVYECNGNNPEPDLNNPLAKDYPFYTDKVVITKGLTSSNKNDIVYCNLTANPNIYPITYANSEDIENLDDLPKYYFYGQELHIPSAKSNNDNNNENNKTFVGWFEDKNFTKHFLNDSYDFSKCIGEKVLYPKYYEDKPLVLYNCPDFKYKNIRIASSNQFNFNYSSLYVSGDSVSDYCLCLVIEEGNTSFGGVYTFYDTSTRYGNNYYFYINKTVEDGNGGTSTVPVLKIITNDDNSIESKFYVDNLSNSKQLLVYDTNTENYYLVENFIEGESSPMTVDCLNDKSLLNLGDINRACELDSGSVRTFAVYNDSIYFAFDTNENFSHHFIIKYDMNQKKFTCESFESEDSDAKITDMIVIMDDGTPALYALVNKQHGYYASNCGYIAKIDMDNLSITNTYGLTENSETIPNANGGYFSDTIIRPATTTANEFFGPHRFIGIEPKKLVISDSGYFYWNITGANSGDCLDVNRIVEFEYDLEKPTLDVFDTDCNFTENNQNASFTTNILYAPSGTYYDTVVYRSDK